MDHQRFLLHSGWILRKILMMILTLLTVLAERVETILMHILNSLLSTVKCRISRVSLNQLVRKFKMWYNSERLLVMGQFSLRLQALVSSNTQSETSSD